MESQHVAIQTCIVYFLKERINVRQKAYFKMLSVYLYGILPRKTPLSDGKLFLKLTWSVKR